MSQIHQLITKCFFLFSLSFFTFQVNAQTIYIKVDGTGDGSSWENAASDLRSKLLEASEGQAVWVAVGTYYPTTCEDCSVDDRNLSFEIPDGVHLYGGFIGTETHIGQRDLANNFTILSGDINQDNNLEDNAYSVLYTENVSASTSIDGFTITNGNAVNTEAAGISRGQSGGGWYNQADINSSPTIVNCHFENNHATLIGGGIYNNSRAGGNSTVIIKDCSFLNNNAQEAGGAIYSDASMDNGFADVKISHCSFENNVSKFGGAIYNNGAEGENRSTITNCLFEANNATSIGGAIYNFGKLGGISTTYIANAIFMENQSSSAGAVYSLASGGSALTDIVNCTFHKNMANTGGAVYCNESDDGDANTKMRNCIFWENIGNFNEHFHMSGNGTPTMDLDYCLIDAEDCLDIMQLDPTDNLLCGTSILFNQNPLFEDAVNGNFHLQIGSPAIDYGDNTSIAEDCSFDLDSLLRIHNDIIDLGPYEYDALQYIPLSILSHPQNVEACESAEVTFTIAAQGTASLTYQWRKDSVDIPDATSPNYTITNSLITDNGSYDCVVQDFLNTQIISNKAILDVNENLQVGIEITSNGDSFCEGSEVTFMVITENGGDMPSYQWQVNGMMVGNDTMTYTTSSLSNNDEVSCSINSSENCTIMNPIVAESLIIQIDSLVTPEISVEVDKDSICLGDEVIFTAFSSNQGTNPTFDWLINDISVMENNSSFVTNELQNQDILTCKMISSLACTSSTEVLSNEIVITVDSCLTTQITSFTDKSQLQIFPNPNPGILNISTQKIEGNVKVLLYDLNGRMWFDTNLNVNSSNAYQLDFSVFPKGFYFIKLIHLNQIQVERILLYSAN